MTTAGVMVATVAGRAIGFFIPFFIANWYGVNEDTEAFFFVYGWAAFFVVVLGDLVEAVLVPVVAEGVVVAGSTTTARIVRRAMYLAGLAALWCYLGGLFALGGASRVWAGGSFDWAGALGMYAGAGPMLILAVLGSVPSAAMLGNGHFLIPAVSHGLRGAVTLGVMYLARDFGVGMVLVLAYTAGEAARFVLVATAAHRRGLLRSVGQPPDVPPVSLPRRAVVAFQMVALLTAGLNPLISRFAATQLALGSVTLVEVGEKLLWVPMMLFHAAISTVGLARWSDVYHREGLTVARRMIGNAFVLTCLAGLGCSALVFAVGGGVADILLSTTVVAQLGSDTLTDVARLYGAGIVPFALLMVVQRSLLVLRGSRALLISGAVGSLANIAMLGVLTPRMGVRGIAISTSLTHVVCLAVAAALAYRAWHPAQVEAA
jgi:peptidoglycan biosynthesis protein MviN/MurJ (putative lipid II flippase)